MSGKPDYRTNVDDCVECWAPFEETHLCRRYQDPGDGGVCAYYSHMECDCKEAA